MTLEPANSLKVGMLTPQSLNTKDFANLLQENFEKIDTDKDGILGQTELKTFSAKGSEDLRSREAARVAAYHTEALGTLAVDSNKQFASKIGTDLSRGINTFDKLFLEKGDVADNQGITAKDLQVLKLLHESDKFESEVHKARKSEKIWGGVATIGGIVAVGVLGYLSFRTNSARTGINYALGGAQALNVVVAGAKSWANSRVEPALRQEYTARQEMLQSWNYFSR